MHFCKSAVAACLGMMAGLAPVNATVVTLNDNFYASGFTTTQVGVPPAPVDPVFGNFSITFDDAVSQLYLSPTNHQIIGIPSNFMFSSNLPGLLSTATFLNSVPSLKTFSIVENVDTTGIPQVSLGPNQISLGFNLLDPSQDVLSYMENGFATYRTSNITFTPVSNSVPEPISILLLAGGLLGMAVAYSRKPKPACTTFAREGT